MFKQLCRFSIFGLLVWGLGLGSLELRVGIHLPHQTLLLLIPRFSTHLGLSEN